MKPVILRPGIGDNRPTATLYYGQDTRESLRALPEASIHTVCTSPPYWGLRDYGTATWEGGDAECEHRVRSTSSIAAGMQSSTLGGGKGTVNHSKEGFHTVCKRCGARRVDAQIGLEESPEAFVASLVEVFREIKRVLRPDGTLWVNLGDSYAGGGRAGKNPEYQRRHTMFGKEVDGSATGQFGLPMTVPEGLKPKDLVGIPWRVAFALQADGWYLRADIIWSKPSCMPESVTDRPTKAHEYVFLFAHPDSGGKYFYDADAVKEPAKYGEHHTKYSGTYTRHKVEAMQVEGAINGENYQRGMQQAMKNPLQKNKRSVWTVNPKPYKGSHFAVWPPDLVRPMILAGTSACGVCSKCGAPWTRVLEDNHQPNAYGAGGGPKAEQSEADRLAGGVGRMDGGRRATSGSSFNNNPAKRPPSPQTTGWQSSCDCVDAQTIPATVLDPFSGSATTGMVALQEGRNYIGLDLNRNYLPLAEARVQDIPAPETGVSDSSGDIFDLFGGGA